MRKLNILVCIIAVNLFGQLVTSGTCFAPCIICPKAITVDQNLAKPDSIWEAFQEDVSHQLMAVTIFDGHPKEKAALVPDIKTEPKDHLVCKWRLTANKARRYWIACAYDRTSIMLIRPLDPNISIIEITYDPQISIGGHPSVVRISCN